MKNNNIIYVDTDTKFELCTGHYLNFFGGTLRDKDLFIIINEPNGDASENIPVKKLHKAEELCEKFIKERDINKESCKELEILLEEIFEYGVQVFTKKGFDSTKTLKVQLNFCWDDGDESKKYNLSVPKSLYESEVSEILQKEHKYLDEEDVTGIYDKNGRSPETLMGYVCKKYGWAYENLEVDLNINFN